jgi:hypothetical protein
MSGDEGAGLAARHKAQILKVVNRQMSKGIVDHQWSTSLCMMPTSAKAFGHAKRSARGGEVLHLAGFRHLDTSPVPRR